jgi:signal transduction histidine kinase
MFWNINTIGKRLFLSFSILALNVVLISVLSYQFNVTNKNIYHVSKRIENQRIHILQILKLDLDFLRFETINQEFYSSGKSKLLTNRDSLYSLIIEENNALLADMKKTSPDIQSQFNTIDSTLKLYDATFKSIKNKIIQRGFKDFGLEGDMRKYAHELEKHSNEINLVDVLTLRRHEKDFFLRKENQYKVKLNSLADQLIKNNNSNKPKNDFLIYLLTSYQSTFNTLTNIDEQIGLLPTQGLLGNLNSLTNNLSDQLEILIVISDEHANGTIKRSLLTFCIIGLGSIIISFTLTYITVIRLTRPIKKLSNTIGKYMVNQGLNEGELDDPAVTNEINSLSGAFIKLTRKLKAQFTEIQKKSQLVEKRNLELQKLNEELDRFIYSAAHDLKSPLASMEGLVHLAKREINVIEHEHYFDKMKSSIEKMEGFIKDITDYAKNKRQQIKADKINLQLMVHEILQSLQFIVNAEDIDKIVEINGGEFYTDKTRLEIILKNILSNGIRYADHDKNQGFIKINALIQQQYTTITVEDNGIGIDDKHIYKIFDMFYRATDNAKGSGIGLFLVRESVKMLRGTIAVQSELGKGTTFTLHLPNLKMLNVNHLPESEPVKFLTAS